MPEPKAPSLMPGLRPTGLVRASAAPEARSLLDLMSDGFYMLFLLRNRFTPTGAEEFRNKVREFLVGFERGIAKLQTPAEDLYLSKYAFCAVVDEVVLTSCERIRDAWERRPLQLELFGDQLAGEGFFEKLEEIRRQGAAKIQVLEVFHMCLLVGFQGKYLLEGTEKLGYLTSRLGDEIAHLKGKRAAFAPHWDAPDRISHKLRAEVPLWVIGSVIALASLLAFIGIRWSLDRQTQVDLGKYSQVINMPAQTAHVTITLP
jgi:type VI secretion system protein ImpK